ncbi:AMIN-like domain-containing (lipo)protein [Streptomyces kronopolitis]|uniref:AMIN-like domain-containing (lipo)protein n=1 Tax=Streptomyces kronopolitis TaxID=1612435 RepID=UPI003432A66F
MRRWRTVAAALVLAGAGVAGTAGAAEAATGPVDNAAPPAACSAVWGSGDKSLADADAAPLTNIRTGRHACYDRMVFDTGAAAGRLGYHVGYVDAFHQDGSGARIPVKGGAILQIYVSAPSYDPATGQQTYAGSAGKSLPGVDIGGYKTFTDTKFGASFEGQTQIGLGVRAKLPFRVLQSGHQLIVDVAHTW